MEKNKATASNRPWDSPVLPRRPGRLCLLYLQTHLPMSEHLRPQGFRYFWTNHLAIKPPSFLLLGCCCCCWWWWWWWLWLVLDVDCWLMIVVHQQVSSNPWYQIFKFLTSKAKACRVFPQRQVLQPTPLPQPEVGKLSSCPCSLMSDQWDDFCFSTCLVFFAWFSMIFSRFSEMFHDGYVVVASSSSSSAFW